MTLKFGEALLGEALGVKGDEDDDDGGGWPSFLGVFASLARWVRKKDSNNNAYSILGEFTEPWVVCLRIVYRCVAVCNLS